MSTQGQAPTTDEIEITPTMIEAAAWALSDWLADGRSADTPMFAVKIGVEHVLKAALGGRAKSANEGRNVIS